MSRQMNHHHIKPHLLDAHVPGKWHPAPHSRIFVKVAPHIAFLLKHVSAFD